MRRLFPAGLGLAMLGFAAPARATTDPPPERYEYYGPVRICDRGFAFDVRRGEGYLKHGYPNAYWTHFIMWNDGYLNLGEPWAPDEEPLKQLARPRGELELAGQRLQRFDISTKDRPRAFAYVYEIEGNAGRFPIESSLFDGSERDRAILERILLGKRGREACSAVPAALKPEPKEQWNEAFWLSPDRHSGPVTVCAAGLAFDVARGEAALLPWRWRQVSSFFRVITGDGHADVAGLEERVWRRGGEPDVEGPVALDPRFTTRSLGKSPSRVRNNFLDSAPDAELVLLSRRADAQPDRPDGKEPVSFTFAWGATETQQQAFVRRLRTQRPDDRCLGAKRP